MDKYDIFISYRRSSYDTANLIATRLKAAGYSVFFDIESLRSGLFNKQLYNVIDNCKDFLVILPENALDRCENESDWVRLEVCHAMSKGKNIIPVLLNGFIWPDPMPKGMENLCFYQSLSASSSEYFDSSMEKLQRQYLHSKRHVPTNILLKYSCITLLTIAIFFAITFGVFTLLSRDACTKYATIMTKEANHVHVLAEEQNKLNKDWEAFRNAIQYEHQSERVHQLQEDMLTRVELAEINVNQFWHKDSTQLIISNYNRFLLSLHGINTEEISMYPITTAVFHADYCNQLKSMRQAINSLRYIELLYVSTEHEVFVHSVNSYYASVLSDISDFPHWSLQSFNEVSPSWKCFPIQLYKIGEEKSYYDNIVKAENGLAEEALARLRNVLTQQEAEMYDLVRKNDSLEIFVNKSVERITKENEDTRRIIEGRVQQLSTGAVNNYDKQIHDDANNAEFQMLDDNFMDLYKTLSAECEIHESEDGNRQWGKILRWGQFIYFLSNCQKELEAEGVAFNSSITAEFAYSNMIPMLDGFQKYHPDSQDYIPAVRLFFKEVSTARREYAGVLIYAFHNNTTHPHFKKGDIIIRYNGNAITDYNNLNKEYLKDNAGTVSFLRLHDNQFKICQVPLEDVGIVGFLDLTLPMPSN